MFGAEPNVKIIIRAPKSRQLLATRLVAPGVDQVRVPVLLVPLAEAWDALGRVSVARPRLAALGVLAKSLAYRHVALEQVRLAPGRAFVPGLAIRRDLSTTLCLALSMNEVNVALHPVGAAHARPAARGAKNGKLDAGRATPVSR